MVLLFSCFLPRLRVINDSYDFVVDRDPVTEYFHRFRTLFKRDEFFVIAYRQPDLFTEPHLRDLRNLTESLESVEGVSEVLSLANAVDMRGTRDSFDARDFLGDVPTSAKALSDLKKRALANPLYAKTLLSKDGETTAILLFTPRLDPAKENNIDERIRSLLRAVDSRLRPYRERGTQFALAGWPVTTYTLAKYMEDDARFFLPVSLLLTMGALGVLFRNTRLFMMASVGIGLTLAATLGLAGWAGIPINNASIAAIPLVMALALSDVIHVFSHLDRQRLDENEGNPRLAMKSAIRAVLFPCLLTSVNTGIGFFSFTLNHVPAMRSFGWLASTGMVIEFLVTFGVVTPLLTFLDPDKIYRDSREHQNRVIPRVLGTAHHAVARRPWLCLLTCAGFAAWGLYFSRSIEINTNLEKLFDPGTTLRKDLNFVRGRLGGIDSISVVLESTPGRFKEPDVLNAIDALEDKIRAVPRVEKVTGFGDYLKEMNKAFHGEDPRAYRLPATRNMVEQFLLLYGRDDVEEFSTPAFDVTRLMIQAQTPGSIDARTLILNIRRILEESPIDGVRPTITGTVALGARTWTLMVEDQVRNIGQTVVVIWLIMLVVLRSWGLSLLFLVPNLFPIAVNFGIMGCFGIPLDTGTSLIASSAFGIIVDDTVHFFVAYGQRRREGFSAEDSLRETSFEKGESSLSSFVIMLSAFGVLTVSHFPPIFYFGLLNVMILVVGMAGDHLLLKSIMVLLSRWIDRPGRRDKESVPRSA